MKLIETRRIETGKVRQMCIREDYYTQGTVDEYCKMFQKCELDFPILEIAIDIFEHSDKEKLLHYNSEKEILENICYGLINDCTYTCVDIEEE